VYDTHGGRGGLCRNPKEGGGLRKQVDTRESNTKVYLKIVGWDGFDDVGLCQDRHKWRAVA
jgi:hypothetical protein